MRRSRSPSARRVCARSLLVFLGRGTRGRRRGRFGYLRGSAHDGGFRRGRRRGGRGLGSAAPSLVRLTAGFFAVSGRSYPLGPSPCAGRLRPLGLVHAVAFFRDRPRVRRDDLGGGKARGKHGLVRKHFSPPWGIRRIYVHPVGSGPHLAQHPRTRLAETTRGGRSQQEQNRKNSQPSHGGLFPALPGDPRPISAAAARSAAGGRFCFQCYHVRLVFDPSRRGAACRLPPPPFPRAGKLHVLDSYVTGRPRPGRLSAQTALPHSLADRDSPSRRSE